MTDSSTDSSNGLDVIEQRFERRPRTVRPPRRPRREAEGTEQDDSKQGATPQSDASPDDTGQEVVENRPVAQGAQQGQPASGGAATQLQQQIADAIAPVMNDLQQQIADAIRQQVRQATDSEVQDDGLQSQVDEMLEPVAQAVQQSVAEEIESAQQTPEATPQEGKRSRIGTALRMALTGLRKTLGALARMIKGLVRSIKRFFVMLLRKFVLAALRSIVRRMLLSLLNRLKDASQSSPTTDEAPRSASAKA